MTEAPVLRRKRRGARAAMHAIRAAKLPDEQQPVRPGMEGGRFKPLTDAEVQRIHSGCWMCSKTWGLSPGNTLVYRNRYQGRWLG